MTSLSNVLAPFSELNDLKRIYSAGRTGSAATRLFTTAWTALTDGSRADVVAGWIVGRALAAARLGDIEGALLVAAGVSLADTQQIEQSAMQAVAGAMLTPVQDLIDRGRSVELSPESECPAFVAALSQQPRAGMTCPGQPRILLEPPENHADHCLMVAVYGVLLSSHYHAAPGRVFLAALSHHFHNAGLPDSGFAGEALLGPHLKTVMAHFTDDCLRQLAPALRAEVEQARAILPDANTPDGRAFHAADVIDRVLQLNQYTRAATLTPEQMLDEMELVHAGPVKAFQDDVLRQAGLL